MIRKFIKNLRIREYLFVPYRRGYLEPLYIYRALFIYNKKGRYIGGLPSRVVHHHFRTQGMGGMTAQAP